MSFLTYRSMAHCWLTTHSLYPLNATSFFFSCSSSTLQTLLIFLSLSQKSLFFSSILLIEARAISSSLVIRRSSDYFWRSRSVCFLFYSLSFCISLVLRVKSWSRSSYSFFIFYYKVFFIENSSCVKFLLYDLSALISCYFSQIIFLKQSLSFSISSSLCSY